MTTVSRAQMPLAIASVGPEKWRSETNRELQFSSEVITKSDRHNEIGKCTNTLPHIRDQLVELSNDTAFDYMRLNRKVANRLREAFIDVNEELKAVIKIRGSIEKELDNIRKGILINKDSEQIRATRPERESDFDGADDLLKVEKQHLLNLKRMLEIQLEKVVFGIQNLGSVRTRLLKVLKERSRVLDLICNTASSSNNPSRPRTHFEFQRSRTDPEMNLHRPSTPDVVDPIGAFTPECAEALTEAKDNCIAAAALCKDAKETVTKSRQLAEAAHKAVNAGLDRKLAETVCLAQKMEMSLASNRAGTYRAQRFYDQTEHSYKTIVGPELYSDLSTAERLNRPHMKVFQRHPGNQNSECREAVKAARGLNFVMQKTSGHIGQMKLTRLLLEDNLADKKAAADIDSMLVHMRRRHFNNKWSIRNPVRSYPSAAALRSSSEFRKTCSKSIPRLSSTKSCLG